MATEQKIDDFIAKYNQKNYTCPYSLCLKREGETWEEHRTILSGHQFRIITRCRFNTTPLPPGYVVVRKAKATIELFQAPPEIIQMFKYSPNCRACLGNREKPEDHFYLRLGTGDTLFERTCRLTVRNSTLDHPELYSKVIRPGTWTLNPVQTEAKVQQVALVKSVATAMTDSSEHEPQYELEKRATYAGFASYKEMMKSF